MAGNGRVLALMTLLVLPTPLAAEPARSDAERPAAVLKEGGIEPSAAGVLAFLRQQQPTAESLARIASLVKQLGSDRYAARESAAQQLAACGKTAEALLRDAVKSDDLEVRYRAGQLLRQFEQDKGRQRSQQLLLAALAWLKDSPTPQATATLLDLLPVLADESSRQAACEALWACAGPADAEQLRKALRQGSPLVRAAAIPALELAEGDAAVGLLQPFLQHTDEALRLAAARALLDRRPQQSVAALLGLLASPDAGLRMQAAWLLQQVSGIPPARDYTLDFADAVRKWKTWAAGAERYAAVGRKRLQVAYYGGIFVESFANDAAEVRKDYHLLQYESTIGGKASVARGMLRLDGNHPEGDQRLCATAARVLGTPCFPPAFRVKAMLGGEATEAGAWHVGVSLGNARVLFHPGMEGGHFRVERLDNHECLVQSEMMPFTPGGGVLHEMTLDVQCRPDGSVQLGVVIVDGAKSGQRFTRNATLKKADVGELRRIGLERSGRTGGKALFGSLAIQQLP